jgi:hypothetical protein
VCIGVSARMTCLSCTPARRGPGTAQKPVRSTRGIAPNIVRRFIRACKPAVALIRTLGCVNDPFVNRLIDYLRQNLMIDFQGDLSLAKVRELLAGDDSRDAKALLAKLVAERNVNDMVLVLADCLLEPVQHALSDDLMREQLRMYTES